jgi:hypothetical protein
LKSIIENEDLMRTEMELLDDLLEEEDARMLEA